MNKLNKKINVKTIIWPVYGIATIAVITLSYYLVKHNVTPQAPLYWIISIIFLCWFFFLPCYGIYIWFSNIIRNIDTYNKDHNLWNGIIGWSLLMLTFIVLLEYLKSTFNIPILKEIGDNVVTTLYALIPSMWALLGLHYDITIQQYNRKEDLRMSQKPYFSLEHRIISLDQDIQAPTGFSCKVKIINISNNIGIPIGFSLKDYNELTSWCDYKPITQDQFYELFIRVNNKVPFSKRFIILTFYYKDILNNYYQSDFDICLNDIDDRKMYTTRLLNNKLCINDTVNWLEKTEFTEHKDYTYVTDV